MIDELNDNLIEVGGGELLAASASDYPAPPLLRQFYLIYFCSFFTTSNSRQQEFFDQIVEFLSYVQEKIECSIRIVLVSSDFLESDYEKLIEKYRDEAATAANNTFNPKVFKFE